MGKLYINKHIRLTNNSIYVNSEQVFCVGIGDGFSEFAKSAYKKYDIKYNKFYKMDALSKHGFLTSEILLMDIDKENILPEEIAIVCANSSSSLHTDVLFQKTIPEIPSPAVFVYTLPNIVIGEICIRNNIKGESLFLIHESFDVHFIYHYLESLFKNNNTKLCITGWLEMSMNEEYRSDLFLISENISDLEFSETNLNLIYKS